MKLGEILDFFLRSTPGQIEKPGTNAAECSKKARRKMLIAPGFMQILDY